MAQKGVNLLGGDEEGEEDEKPEEDYDDDDLVDSLEPGKKKKKSGGAGGGLIKKIGIAVVVLVLVGGGWAGYKFSVASQEKEQKRVAALKRQEELRKRRLEIAKKEEERRKREIELLKKLQQSNVEEKESPAKGEKKAEEGGEKKTSLQPAAPAPTTPKGPPPAQPVAKGKAEPKKDVPVQVEKPTPPAAPLPAMPKPAPPAGRRVQARERTPPAPPSQSARMDGGSSKPTVPKPALRGVAYSVQVASCRFDRCVNSFVRRLRDKGFSPIVQARRVAVRLSEVLLGEFASREGANALIDSARVKNISATTYRANGLWRVSAGSFNDLEDAAQRLDLVEDAGLKGRLTSRPRLGNRGVRTVRSGVFGSRREALAMRQRVIQAGFPGSIVVRQRAPR